MMEIIDESELIKMGNRISKREAIRTAVEAMIQESINKSKIGLYHHRHKDEDYPPDDIFDTIIPIIKEDK